MDVPRGGNVHFKESVYELHKRESHGFSPSVSHRLGSRSIATRCWKARCGSGYEGLSGRCAKSWASRSYPAFCRENMSICSWKSRRILRSATSCGASRDGRRIGVPGLAQALLGAAFLGSGLLLHHEWQHHGRCHTSVSSGVRTYRR